MPRLETVAQLMERISVSTSGCWEWARYRNRQGYGAVRYRGAVVHAHRASWEICRGDIPAGMDVLHHCDNKACVNPEHLYIGTDFDNQRDVVARNRRRVRRGEDNGFSRLTERSVIDMRARHRLGETQVALASAFGVSQGTVSMVVRGIHWSHVRAS